MKDIVEKILNKEYDEANSLFEEAIVDIVAEKLHEMKKATAAKKFTSLPFNPSVKASRKRIKGVRKAFSKDTLELKPMQKVAEDVESLEEERKRTKKVADAFMRGEEASEKTLRTDGEQITYHGKVIAKHEGDEVHVTTAGYGSSPSTRGHVNGILRRLGAPTLSQKKHNLYHGDQEYDGDSWIKVKKPSASKLDEGLKHLIATALKGKKIQKVSAKTAELSPDRQAHYVGKINKITGKKKDK